jgi:hypothetical protein
MRRARAKPPAQSVGLAESKRKRTSWQKPATAHSAQAGIFKRRIRLNWAPAVDLDTLMGVLGTSAMRRIVCLCFWAPGTQPPTASACPLALGPFLFSVRPPWPRFNDAMPVLTRRRNLEASDDAGRSTLETSASARSRSAPATRTTPIRGNGCAASIRARIRASTRAAPPPPSTTARGDFEAASRVFLSNRTEADFQAWRDERD